MENPVGGLVPDFTIFGAEFTEWWQKLFVAAWALAIIISIFFLLRGLVVMGSADDNPHDYKKAKGQAIKAGIALACIAAFTIIVGVILTVAG